MSPSPWPERLGYRWPSPRDEEIKGPRTGNGMPIERGQRGLTSVADVALPYHRCVIRCAAQEAGEALLSRMNKEKVLEELSVGAMWRFTAIQTIGEAYYDVLIVLRNARMSLHQAVLHNERRSAMLQQELGSEDLDPKGWMSLGEGYARGMIEQLRSGRAVEESTAALRVAEFKEAEARGVFLEGVAECCKTILEDEYHRGMNRGNLADCSYRMQSDSLAEWSDSCVGYHWGFANSFRGELRGRMLDGLGCHQRGFV